MGVTGLGHLLADASPHAISKETTLKTYKGKAIAFDASIYLYESVAPRRTRKQIMSEKEDMRSPLVHSFNSCIRLLENGIKPLFVFDGEPPKLKKTAIKERREKKEKAKEEFNEAESKGDKIRMEELRPKTAKVTKTVTKNCKSLLKLMGIPYFKAPGEAEAQCATFVESGLVYATATMDYDALTFGTKVILRNIALIRRTTKTHPIQEIHLDKVLATLGLSFEEFVELSIIMGCDYCKGIGGMGAHRAIELIHKYKTIESILDSTDLGRYSVPEEWLYKEARNAFLNPTVKKCESLKEPITWNEPDVQGTLDFLSDQQGYDEKQFRTRLKNVSTAS